MQENNLNITPPPAPYNPERMVSGAEPGVEGKPQNSSILIVLSILLIVLVGVVAFLAYQNWILQKQINLLKTSPVSDIQTLNLLGCSTKNPNFSYSIQVPSTWSSTKKKDDINRTVYEISDDGNRSISINCDTAGVGSVICINGGVSDGKDGCFWQSGSSGNLHGQFNISNLFGTFVFNTNGIEKTQIDQVLSTFKFLGGSPSPTCKPRPACLDATPRCLIPETSDMCPPPTPIVKACTMEAKLCPGGNYVGRTGPNCEFAPCP